MEFNLYEFIGVLIGDGCLMDYPHLRAYRVEITGNVVEERDYYEKISSFLQAEFSLKPKVFTRTYNDGSRGLKLLVNNKKFVSFLKNEYGFTNNKTYTVEIPNHLMTWEKSKHILRGIFETDGCLYFSKSRVTTNKPTYPRLEITTVSIKLANQIIKILKENGFSVQNHKNRSSTVIYLSGEEMLQKWINEIGFSSNKNWSKYLLWKKLGYYIPKITLPERLSLLRSKDLQIIPEII